MFSSAEEVRLPVTMEAHSSSLRSTMTTICFQFGFLLDENAGSKFDSIGLNAVANTDRAGETATLSVSLARAQTVGRHLLFRMIVCLVSRNKPEFVVTVTRLDLCVLP